jgi:hypothetical protein
VRLAPPPVEPIRAIARRGGGAGDRASMPATPRSPDFVVRAEARDEFAVRATGESVREIEYAGSAAVLRATTIADLGATHASVRLNHAARSFI